MKKFYAIKKIRDGIWLHPLFKYLNQCPLQPKGVIGYHAVWIHPFDINASLCFG